MTTASFQLFNGDANLTGISVTQDGYQMTITNQAATGVITGIWFERQVSAEPIPGFALKVSKNLPGGGLLDWSAETDEPWIAIAPPVKNGIQPGESKTFDVGTNYFGRVAIHVQAIGPSDSSSSFVATVPEPSAACLLAVAALAILRRRAR